VKEMVMEIVIALVPTLSDLYFNLPLLINNNVF